MNPSDDQQTELLRLIWQEMKAVKNSVDTKSEALRDDLRAEMGGLRGEIGELRGEVRELKEDFGVVRKYIAESEIRMATAIVELRKDHEQYRDLRTRLERLEHHTGIAS